VEEMHHAYMPKGTIVFEEGSIGEEFYIILKGEVGIYLDSKNSKEGRLNENYLDD
jgi:CRP-like cAMP-binding protein